MPRAIAGLLVLLLTNTIGAPLTCIGWAGSATSRRKCCKRAGHEGCPDQQTVDNCCAAHEQSRHLTLALSSLVPASPCAVVALCVAALDAAALDRTAALLLDVVLSTRLQGPPPPLISPLRI